MGSMGVGPADVRDECPSAGRGRVGVGKSLGVGARSLEMLRLGPCPVHRTARGPAVWLWPAYLGLRSGLESELIMLPPDWGRVSGWKGSSSPVRCHLGAPHPP